MEHKNIITLPNKKLRERSKKVGYISSETKELVERMQKATLSWEDHREHEVGVALAAVQIAQMQKVIIVREDFEDKSNRNFQVFINPEITKQEGKVIEDFEGCLSIKNIYGRVPRYDKIKLKAMDIDGKEFRVTAEGFLARVFQHEIDHLKGTLFIDHIKDMPESFYKLKGDGSLEKLNYESVKSNRILW
jgi:peptide deformylase